MQLLILAASVSILMQKSILRSAPFLLFGLCILVQTISWINSHLYHPDLAETSLKLHRLAPWFLFIPVAWTLRTNNQSPWLLLTLALTGFFLATWTNGEGIDDFIKGSNGKRPGFGTINAEHASMLSATALIGLIIFSKRAYQSQKTSRSKALAIIATVAAMIYAAALLKLSDTRAIFLGFSIAIITIVSFFLFQTLKGEHKTRSLTYGSICFAMLLSIIALNYQYINSERWQKESRTLSAITSFNFERIPYSSIGVRIHTWLEAFKFYEQRPIVGWGGNGKKLAIQTSTNLPENIRNKFRHLHNTYLEVAVNYGALGLAALASLYFWTFTHITSAWRRRMIHTDIYAFYMAYFSMWLIVNCFESYMFYSTGIYIYGLLTGITLHYTWPNHTHIHKQQNNSK
ncbi:MAG: O-antigen ligase family protein [Ketobacter sp.]|nr:O-antigen ligase family protein [Ketobacter sp.]